MSAYFPTNSVKQNGLEWIQSLFGLMPRWTTEPNQKAIESLARRYLTLDINARCEIHFYAEGAFNKLYRVNTDSRKVLMRVSLPVDPHYKTMREVAAIEFARLNIVMTVPKIFAFDASSDNELGFEWILMEMMPGQPLHKAWRKLPMCAKEGLVRQIVCYQARLFEERFQGTGSIYHAPPASPHGAIGENMCQFDVGRIVSHVFFWGNNLFCDDVSRGPFLSSHDWLHARLVLTLRDQEQILRDSHDEDDLEDATNAKEIMQKLLEILPIVFPPAEKSNSESTILHHDDLTMQNILVDEAGKLTAVVDWECVSTLPLWRACQIPDLLEGRDHNEEPRRENYSTDQPETGDGYEAPADELDNEGVNSLYWEHLLEYEQTQLRQLFMAEMTRLQPGWVEESASKQAMLKADFEKAVHNADNGFCFKIIRKWIDSYIVGDGEVWSLRGRLME